MTKARVIGDLLVAHDSGAIDDETEIIILHGAKSRVSSREDNQFLVTNLEQNGVKPAVWNTYDDESHGIIDSINRTHALFADFASD